MVKEITLTNQSTLAIFGSDENSFMVTSTLIISNGKALLIGAKFTQADALEIVDYLKTNQLDLEKVLVIHGDPDYYFGLETIKKAFPDALAIATQPTVHHILESLEEKLTVWKDALGDQAPKNVIIPQILTSNSITFGQVEWQLIGSDAGRVNLWEPESKTLIGGIDTFNEIHLFLADTKSAEALTSWSIRMAELIALDPKVVIPSHGDVDKSLDISALSYTKEYLAKAIKTLSKIETSEDFQAELATTYPDSKNVGVLALSSKVLTNEIPWGE